MHQVLDLLEKWGQRKEQPSARPPQPPRMLTFDFIGDDAFGESDSYLDLPGAQPVSSCLGRTESCLGVSQLSDATCLEDIPHHGSSNVVYLQRDARSEAEADPTPVNERKGRRYQNPKVRATALLDASELLQIRRGSSDAYSRLRPEQTASKQVSIEVLRKLGQRSSREELLEKIKDACDKVSAEALINSPGRRPATGPLRQTICIQIG